MAFVY